MYKVGQLIRIARDTHGLSQEDLAKKLQVKKNYISLIENDKKNPSVKFLQNAADILDIPLVLLMWEKLDIPKAKSPAEREIKKHFEELTEKAQKLFADRIFKAHK